MTPKAPASSRFLRAGFLLWLAVATSVFGESEWFMRSWQTDEGLPNNYVSAISQAPDGYLWVVTQAGLCRFDGVHFTPFLYKNDEQNIGTMTVGPLGRLWIAPFRGPIVGLNADFSRASLPTDRLPKERPYSIVEDRENGVWLLYAAAVYHVKDGNVSMLSTNEGVPHQSGFYRLITDYEGNVWLSKSGIVAVHRDGRFIPFPKVPGARIAPARSGGVWIGNGARVLKADASGKIEDIGPVLPANSSRAEIWVLMEDHTGALWIGTDNSGLYRKDETGIQKIDTSQPSILSLAEDREGNIWVGTAGGGLDRISHRAVRLEGYDDGSSRPVPLLSVCEDPHHILWGATQNGLLVRRTAGDWAPAFTNRLQPGLVTCVAVDRRGVLWIGTRNRRIYRWYNNELIYLDQQKGVGSHAIINLLPLSNGDVWVAGAGVPAALQCIRNDEIVNPEMSARSFGRLTAMAEDAGHTLWAGNNSGTLWHLVGDRFLNESALTGVTNRAILSLYGADDGALWIGYDGAGLGRLKNGHFKLITTDGGLGDNRICQITPDANGWLWFGSGRGIFKVRKQALDDALDNGSPIQSIRYGPNEGLFSSEATSANFDPFVSPTALRSWNGHLWIPTRTAIANIDPRVGIGSPEPPPVLLTRMTVDGQPLATYGETFTNPVANLRTLRSSLTLPPNHHRLEFAFTALNFSAPENVHLQYKLDGLDPGWIDADAERHAEYSRLAAGTYLFRVRARNGDGDWSEDKTKLAFIVPAFVWQTWWFRLLTVAAFTAFVIAGVRYISFRRLRMRLQMLEQEAALNRERARIARDIHDDLGGNLTQVKQLFELASRHRASPDQVNEFVQRGLAVTRRGVKSLDETVWAVNPRNDTLPDLINYIGQRTVEFLSTAGVQYHLELPEHPPNKMVPAEVRHNLFYVVKEALNNIVRHAEATEVWLTVVVDEKFLNLVIQDNGRGFENAPDDPCADGLRNMSQRVESIKGRFEMESAPGSGTKIFVTYPWTG